MSLSTCTFVFALLALTGCAGPAQTTAPKTIVDEKAIFQYYDSLPKVFHEHKTEPVMRVFSGDYAEYQVDEKGKEVLEKNHADALASWVWQIEYKGKYAGANGPTLVHLTSIKTTDSKAVVEGYWAGSWRISSGPMVASEGGMSFEDCFRAVWVKKGDVWQLQKLVGLGLEGQAKLDGYASEEQVAKYKASHEALRKKYGQ